jgi:hypothetical protein
MNTSVKKEILMMVTCLILFALVVLGVMNGLSSDTIFYVGFGLFAIYYGVRVGISHLALMEYRGGPRSSGQLYGELSVNDFLL